MFCPLKFNLKEDLEDSHGVSGCQCEASQCAWWNDYWGKCAIAIDAYLRGIEDHRHEIKVDLEDRRHIY